MNKQEKQDIVAEVKELLENSSAVYLTDYKGIEVADINELRGKFRKEGVNYKVYKNTLFKRALDEVGKYDKLADHLVGMTGYVFADENNPIVPAKIIKKYFDDTQKMALKGCYVDDQYYDGSKLKDLASLPSKEEIIAGIMRSIESPASGIVGAINAVMRDLVSVVDQISQREAA